MIIVKVRIPGRPVRSYPATDLRVGNNTVLIKQPNGQTLRLIAPEGTIVTAGK